MFDTTWLKGDDLIDGDKFETLGQSLNKVSYLKIDTALELINHKKELCPANNILITHNGDLPVSSELIHNIDPIKFPLHWFAQNVTVEHPQITPLPIGLERTRWFPEMHKRDILIQYMKSNIKPEKLCLANFSLNTNYKKRQECFDFCSRFSTINTDNSVMYNSYPDFVESVLNHYFVLCPEGNGVDTHRLWETLYLGRIPIVTSNASIESFKDLPILILPGWEQLNQDLLIKYLEDFKSGKITYSLDKLNFLYWKDKIYERLLHP